MQAYYYTAIVTLLVALVYFGMAVSSRPCSYAGWNTCPDNDW